MDIPLDKTIPRVLAFAVVGYCLWPSLMAFFSAPESKEPKKMPELTAALLSPKLPPAPTRDPFVESTPRVDPTVNKVLQAASKALPGKKQTKPIENSASTAKTARRVTTTGSRDAGKPFADRADNQDDNSKKLTLEATSIVNNHRLAVINGRLYAPHDTLSMPWVSETPCEILRVLPYKVVIKCGDKNIELTYPDVSSKPSSAVKRTSGTRSKPTSERASPSRSGSTRKKR